MTARRRVLAIVAALLAVVAAVYVATPGPRGSRAGGLVSATPGDGTALATAPKAVSLTLDRTPDAARSHVGVTDESRTQLATGELTVSGPHAVRQRVKPAGRGIVVVTYHIVFTDGTETIGSFRFSAGAGVAAPDTRDSAQQAAESDASTSGASTHDHGVDPLGAFLLLLDLGVLVGAGLLLTLRPRRGRADRAVHTGPDPE
jgi:methionine-rich copper-binding protein CopC